MHLVVGGATGFLGRHLVEALRAKGHTTTSLVRREPEADDESRWDPSTGLLDAQVVEDADVVVNVAGSPTIGNPHSKKWAEGVRHSRVTTTRVLAGAIAASGTTPAFLAGNGISWYGDQGAAEVPESAPSLGDSLLTNVTREWQEATVPAAAAGSRVVLLRTAPVLDRTSPPLKQLRLLFSLGLGGPIGNGRQYFPVISLRDWVGGVVHLATSDVAGPANLCSAITPTNAEFTKALAGHRELRRSLVDERATAQARADLVGALLAGKVHETTSIVTRRAAYAPRGRSFVVTLVHLGAMAAARRDRVVASVTSATELSAMQLDRLGAILERAYGRTLQLNVTVDADVIGGLRIQTGADVVDSTMLARLAEARRAIAT